MLNYRASSSEIQETIVETFEDHEFVQATEWKQSGPGYLISDFADMDGGKNVTVVGFRVDEEGTVHLYAIPFNVDGERINSSPVGTVDADDDIEDAVLTLCHEVIDAYDFPATIAESLEVQA